MSGSRDSLRLLCNLRRSLFSRNRLLSKSSTERMRALERKEAYRPATICSGPDFSKPFKEGKARDSGPASEDSVPADSSCIVAMRSLIYVLNLGIKELWMEPSPQDIKLVLWGRKGSLWYFQSCIDN